MNFDIPILGNCLPNGGSFAGLEEDGFCQANGSFSQPESVTPSLRYNSDDNAEDDNGNSNDVDHPYEAFSFSQPAATSAEDFFLNSQEVSSQLSQAATNSQEQGHIKTVQRLVKRMTRFCVNTKLNDTVGILRNVLDGLNFSYKIQQQKSPVITVSVTDRRKMQLIFKATVIEMNDATVLLDFRLSRGDGLEFKRYFLQIKEKLKTIENKDPLLTWKLLQGVRTDVPQEHFQMDQDEEFEVDDDSKLHSFGFGLI